MDVKSPKHSTLDRYAMELDRAFSIKVIKNTITWFENNWIKKSFPSYAELIKQAGIEKGDIPEENSEYPQWKIDREDALGMKRGTFPHHSRLTHQQQLILKEKFDDMTTEDRKELFDKIKDPKQLKILFNAGNHIKGKRPNLGGEFKSVSE